MQISKIETIRFNRGITVHAGVVNWLWVRLHTDEGLIGLGETYPAAEAAEAVVAHSLAKVLLGRDPREIDRLWADMLLAVGYHGWAGAEMRAISAIDIALWDLRRHYLKEYEGIVTNTGPSSEGWLKAPPEPGLGVDLDPSVFSRPDVVVHRIEN